MFQRCQIFQALFEYFDDGFSDRLAGGVISSSGFVHSKPKTNPILIHAKRHHLTHSDGHKMGHTEPCPEVHKTLRVAESSNLTLAPRGVLVEVSIRMQHHVKTRASSLPTLPIFASLSFALDMS